MIQEFGQNDIVPYSLVTEDLPLILPERKDVAVSGVGEGRNPTAVLESQFAPGAGSIPNTALPLMMIPRMPGDKTVTHSGAEVWTIVGAAAADITTGTYFSFDVFDGNKDVIKYAAWFDKNGDGATDKPTAPDCYDPVADVDDGVNQTTAIGKRELVQIDISGDTTAQEVADAITAAIDALTGVGAANGAGTTTTVTVTNDNNGSVMDAHDNGSCGLTIAVTTQGYDKIELDLDADTDEMSTYFGFHFQRNNGSEDTLYSLAGCSIAEHVLQVKSGNGLEGVMKEDINYSFAGLKEQYGALTMLDKPRDAYGMVWSKTLSPYHNKHQNHGWHTCNGNETFTYNSVALEVTWFGWTISVKNAISHEYDGGGDFASGVNYNGRTVRIEIDVMPEDMELFQLQREHPNDYDGDVLIQLKSSLPDGDQYVQFDCDKCRVLPFAEKIKADGSPERYTIPLELAPDATATYTIQTYLPSYMFGLGGE